MKLQSHAPNYVHGCAQCVYLGEYLTPKNVVDLYYHENSGLYMARYGPETFQLVVRDEEDSDRITWVGVALERHAQLSFYATSN